MTSSNGSIKTSNTKRKDENNTVERATSYTDEFLNRLDEAVEEIDPRTAEVKWEYRPFSDPYGVLHHDASKVVRQYFARAPRSTMWVSWDDLPVETEVDLWKRHKQTDPALDEPTACW